MVDNAEEFYQIFISGKLPNTIAYNDLLNLFLDNIAINGSSYQVSAQLIGVIISEMCRYKSDISKVYRLSKSKDPTAYTMINIKDVPKLVSPFASVISENWDESIGNALINKNTKSSPLEKLFFK
jgi:hypothetical protein